MTPTSVPRTAPALPSVLWALLCGNFVIGTGVLIVPGWDRRRLLALSLVWHRVLHWAGLASGASRQAGPLPSRG